MAKRRSKTSQDFSSKKVGARGQGQMRVEGKLAARPIQRLYGPLLQRAMAEAFSLSLPRKLEASGSPIARFRQYRGREEVLARNVLGERMWSFQLAVYRALRQHRFVAVRAARKVSKTRTAAGLVLAYELAHETLALTTAPGGRQVKEQLWERIAAIHAHARARDPQLPGELSSTRFTLGPEHYALGLSTNTADRFHGWHAGVVVPDDPDAVVSIEDLDTLRRELANVGNNRMLIVIDEAPGVPREIFNAIQGSLSGSNTYMLLLGNPTLSRYDDHPFVRAFQPGSPFHTIKVSAVPDFDDPMKVDESFVAPNWLVDPQWIEDMRKLWGEDSPMWQAYVLGRFVSDSRKCQFITLGMLERGAALELFDTGDVACRHMGVDIGASDSGDPSVATLLVNGVVAAQHEWKTSDTMATAALILQLAQSWGVGDRAVPAQNIHIDHTGVGTGVVDRLRQMGYYVDAVDFGSSPRYARRDLTGSTLFRNHKAELLWIARRLLEEELLSIPQKYARVWEQAGWYTYGFSARGGGTVVETAESKDQIKSEFGRSPDHFESLIIGLARGGTSRSSIEFVG